MNPGVVHDDDRLLLQSQVLAFELLYQVFNELEECLIVVGSRDEAEPILSLLTDGTYEGNCFKTLLNCRILFPLGMIPPTKLSGSRVKPALVQLNNLEPALFKNGNHLFSIKLPQLLI